MSRELYKHKTNEFNRGIDVIVAKGVGDPQVRTSEYRVHYVRKPPVGELQAFVSTIRFQEGPVREVGRNGISDEVLLAIVIDRLECFQRGPYKCRQNALAITKLEEAMHWLQDRTQERERRGVEGTHEL